LVLLQSAFAGTLEGSRGDRLLRPHDTHAAKAVVHHAHGLNSRPSWTRLKLDVDAFERNQFEPVLRRFETSRVRFTTLSKLGDTPAARRSLYELNKTCSADIPERGAFYTFDEYVDQRLNAAPYDPRGVALALDGDVWAGMTMTSLHRAQDHAFSEMTGILRSHRRQGLSLALKVLAIDFARTSGMRWLRTFHHPTNFAAIAMNRRLGFVDDLDELAAERLH